MASHWQFQVARCRRPLAVIVGLIRTTAMSVSDGLKLKCNRAHTITCILRLQGAYNLNFSPMTQTGNAWGFISWGLYLWGLQKRGRVLTGDWKGHLV